MSRPSSPPPPRMEPTSSFLAAREPPAQTAQLGQGEARWRGWARSALPVILLLAVPVGIAGLVYRARHSRHDLAFVYTTAYYLTGLIALLCWCLEKLQLVPSLDDGPADERPRRVRIAVWIYSVAVASTLALLAADAMPNLALQLAVWGLTAGGMAIALYFTFCRGRSDAGHRPHELSPEEKV